MFSNHRRLAPEPVLFVIELGSHRTCQEIVESKNVSSPVYSDNLILNYKRAGHFSEYLDSSISDIALMR